MELKATKAKVATSYGERTVYIGADKKKYVKVKGQVVPVSKAKQSNKPPTDKKTKASKPTDKSAKKAKKQRGGDLDATDRTTFEGFDLFELELGADDTANLLSKLKEKIPKSCRTTDGTCRPSTYFDVLSAISGGFSENVYLFGGSVRDFIRTGDVSTLNDIDINYTTEVFDVRSRLDKLGVNYKMDDRNYIVAGDKGEHEYLEGFYLAPLTYNKDNLESPGNSLLLKVKSETSMSVIDLFGGQGIEDAKDNVWRSPTSNYKAWLTNQKKLLWRMIKFKLRGYTVPQETSDEVYKFWATSSAITGYSWENMWWSLPGNKLGEILKLLDTDLQSSQTTRFIDLLLKFVSNNLIVANKSG